MATMTVSLPEPMKNWIEALTQKGEYASSSDYVRDLIRRDRERRGQELTLDELRQIVVDSREGGVSTRSVEEIFLEAKKIVLSRQGALSE